MGFCCKKFEKYFGVEENNYPAINFGGEGFEVEPLMVSINFCPFCGVMISAK